VMWGASLCASLHDTPLMFKWQNERQRRLVKAIARDWGKPILVMSRQAVDRCLSKSRSNRSQLQKLDVPAYPLLLPEYKPQAKLARTVVFAAAKTSADVPDIAVGFALANHLARAYGHASFVVVPRYLEANAALEDQLRHEHDPVTGGVVLGQTGIISDDTRALLRQLITTPNSQGLLAQIKSSLGDLRGFVFALLALLGAATAAATTARVAPELVGRGVDWIRDVWIPPSTERSTRVASEGTPREAQKKSSLFGRQTGAHEISPETREPLLLRNIGGPKVTVTAWLRSGWRITGKLEGSEHQSGNGEGSSGYVVELTGVTLEREVEEGHHRRRASSTSACRRRRGATSKSLSARAVEPFAIAGIVILEGQHRPSVGAGNAGSVRPRFAPGRGRTQWAKSPPARCQPSEDADQDTSTRAKST
jgi:hypothetical protein